jgi:hypothetical protein
LLKQAKNLARQRKTTLGAVVSEALRLGLLRADQGAPTASKVPLKTFRGDGLQAGVDLHHSSELLDIMERS